MLTSDLASQSSPQIRGRLAALNTLLAPPLPAGKAVGLGPAAVPQSSPRSLLQKTNPSENQTKLEFKDPNGIRNFLKGPVVSQADPLYRGRPNFFTSRSSTSRDPRSLLSNPHPINGQHQTYKSHEKIPQKLRTARDIYREAALKPIKVDQSALSDKIKITHNLYNKQDRYFYCSRIDIRSIVRGIYYHGQTVDSLDEFKLPAFKAIGMQNEYFDIVWEETRSFIEAVTKTIKSKIARVIRPKDEPCRPSEANLHYVHFLRAPGKYRQVIDHLFNIFKHLEHVNAEVEKLNAYFIEFCREKKRFVEDFKLHAQLIATVYQDHSVGRFVDQQLKTFNKLHIYETKYPDVVEKVYEIHDICKKRMEEIVAVKPQANARERIGSGIDMGNSRAIALSMQAWGQSPDVWLANQGPATRSQRAREATETGSKVNQSQADDNSQAMEVKSEATGKKKKKRKNKKKTATEVSVQAPNEPAAEMVCDEESPQEAAEIKEFADRLAAVDSRFRLEPGKRLRIEFSAEELSSLKILSKVAVKKGD